jgi:hypothetical protein
MSAQIEHRPEPSFVLAKALLNASKQIELKPDERGNVLGLHRTGITRLKQRMELDPKPKQGELALLLIHAARALFALSRGDQVWISHFMRAPNKLTDGIPAEQMQTVQGLSRFVMYLDAIRGKV